MIAAGLNGPWVLQEASCARHEKITSAFEGHILGPVLRSTRAGLGMRMRGRPTTLPLLADRGTGEFIPVEVPVKDYPAVATFLEYSPPAHLDRRPYISGVSVCGQRTIHFAGPPPEEVGRRLGAKTLRWTTTYLGYSFPRLIAKIAYTFVVADVGLSGIETAYVLPAILGKADDIGRWFGCDQIEYITDPRYLHGVTMQVINGEVIVRVRLFVNSHTPEYIVVVGRLTSDAVPGQFQAALPVGITRTRSLTDVLATAEPAPLPSLRPNESISVELSAGLVVKKQPWLLLPTGRKTEDDEPFDAHKAQS